MNKNPSLSKIIWWSFGLCTLLSALLYAISTLFYYDPTENYFAYKALLPKVALILTCLSALLGTLAAFTTSKDRIQGTPLFGKMVPTVTLPGFLLVIPALLSSPTASTSPLPGLTLIAVVLAAAYCLGLWIPNAVQKHANTLAGFGLFALLACLLLDAYLYFDVSVEMNAPVKLLPQIAVLCVMIYYTGELRYLLGKPMPRVFLMMCTWVIAVGLPAAITVILVCLTGKLERFDYLAIAFLVLCAAVTALIRLRTFFKPQSIDSESADSDLRCEHRDEPSCNQCTPNPNDETPGDPTNETGKDLT